MVAIPLAVQLILAWIGRAGAEEAPRVAEALGLTWRLVWYASCNVGNQVPNIVLSVHMPLQVFFLRMSLNLVGQASFWAQMEISGPKVTI